MSGIPYCVLLFRVDGALLAILALALELDVAVNQSKQGVVAADTDIDAGWMCVPLWRTRMLPARTN